MGAERKLMVLDEKNRKGMTIGYFSKPTSSPVINRFGKHVVGKGETPPHQKKQKQNKTKKNKKKRTKTNKQKKKIKTKNKQESKVRRKNT